MVYGYVFHSLSQICIHFMKLDVFDVMWYASSLVDLRSVDDFNWSKSQHLCIYIQYSLNMHFASSLNNYLSARFYWMVSQHPSTKVDDS